MYCAHRSRTHILPIKVPRICNNKNIRVSLYIQLCSARVTATAAAASVKKRRGRNLQFSDRVLKILILL